MSYEDSPRWSSVGVGWVNRSDRVRVEVTGPDRARFLHNLTTNEVKRLAVGRGCEAFVTSTQGRTIGYVVLHATDDRILVRTDPGGMELAGPHLGKYGIFDDVAIEDRSEATCEVHILGAGIDERVRRAGGPVPEGRDYAHAAGELAGHPVRIIRESPAGVAGLTVIGDRRDLRAIVAALEPVAGGSGLPEVDPSVFEALRIEAGTPAFGRDVTEKNLPQEFGRDERAINFVKGCYLGQETVARLDAMGHVNQVLKGLNLESGGTCPAPGSVLEADGKRVGVVTSAAFSPRRGHPVALAMIRSGHASGGTVLQLRGEDGSTPVAATVVNLPVPPRP